MKITKKVLTEKDLQLTLDGTFGMDSITAVYLDKASNYNNAYSSVANKHSFVPEYKQSGTILHISLPKGLPTFFTITIFCNDEIVLGMFVNEFSLFKAKSKYLLVFDNCCACECNNSICIGCNEKSKRYAAIAYMLRLNLFYQSYINENVELATKYYVDACRVYDMDKIYFECLTFKGTGATTSGKMRELFDTLNNWIKGNASACEKKVLESLLIADLYSLIFGDSDFDVPEEEEEDISSMYRGYLAMADIAEFKTMRDVTHDFSLLKPSEVLAGIDSGKVKLDVLTSKTFAMDVPSGATCFFVLIPVNATKRALKFDGISSFVPFEGTSEEMGFQSNGGNKITINGVEYKIYGENSVVGAERTIKIQ